MKHKSRMFLFFVKICASSGSLEQIYESNSAEVLSKLEYFKLHLNYAVCKILSTRKTLTLSKYFKKTLRESVTEKNSARLKRAYFNYLNALTSLKFRPLFFIVSRYNYFKGTEDKNESSFWQFIPELKDRFCQLTCSLNIFCGKKQSVIKSTFG